MLVCRCVPVFHHYTLCPMTSGPGGADPAEYPFFSVGKTVQAIPGYLCISFEKIAQKNSLF